MRLIFLDTETTGLKTGVDRVVELGMVEMIDWRLTGRTFHSYFNTDAQMNWAAQKVHGISKRFLADKPRFDSLVSDINDFIGDAPALVHNASFDQRMYNAEMDFAGRPNLRRDFLCTLKFAKGFVSGGCKLDDLIRGYLPGCPPRGNHSAMEDAELLAKVFLSMRQRHEPLVSRFLSSKSVPQAVSREASLFSGPRTPNNAPVGGVIDFSQLRLNDGVSEAINKANRDQGDEALLEIRTGRDGFSSINGELALNELTKRGVNGLNGLDDLTQTRKDSALRMMLRGLSPELAVRRERLLAEKYDSDLRI